MKKLLIIGAGFEQIPAYKIAREMGISVIGTDLNPNAPGFEFADKSFVVSTNDYEGNLEVARNEKIDGVMTLISETAIPVVGKLSTELNLPGFSVDTAIKATNKNVMRDAMEEFGVPIPAVSKVENNSDAITFAEKHKSPWVIKPSDSSGQRGVTFTHKIEDLPEAVAEAKKYSTDNIAVIEEYVTGPEINVCAIVKDEKVKILSLSNRVTLPSPNFGVAVTHIAPAFISEENKAKVEQIAIDSIKAIGLKEGIAYPQIIAGEEDVRLIEIAARIPGGSMREVAMHYSGIDMVRVAILQALGEDYDFETVKTEPAYSSVYVRHITGRNVNIGDESVETLEGVEEVKMMNGIEDCFMRLEKSLKVPKLESGVQRFGAIIATGDSFKQSYERINNAFNTIKVNGKSLIDYENYHPSYYEFFK